MGGRSHETLEVGRGRPQPDLTLSFTGSCGRLAEVAKMRGSARSGWLPGGRRRQTAADGRWRLGSGGRLLLQGELDYAAPCLSNRWTAHGLLSSLQPSGRQLDLTAGHA